MLKLNIQRFANGGSIEIEVKANTKPFDKDMIELQKRMHELAEKAQKPIKIDGATVSGGWNLSEEEQKEYDEIYSTLNEINQKEQERLDVEKQIIQEQERLSQEAQNQTEQTDQQISKSMQLLANIRDMADSYNLISKQPIKTENDINEINRLKNSIAEAVREYEKLTGKTLSVKGLTDVNNNINNVGNSMEKVTKKVAKWGLAIFGIRSMYMGIRQVVGQLLQSDEGLKAQIDYMKWSIGQAIKPIVEWLVNAVHQLLVWIGAIIKILFGINIFAGATAKNFQKANSSAKKLQKTLAGFDEMNVINEDGSTGIGSSIGNALKGWDLGKEVDELAEKLKPFEDTIKGIALVAAGIFGAKMIGGWISNLGSFMGAKGLGKLGSKLASVAAIAGGIAITALVAKQVWDEARELEDKMKKITEEGAKGQEKWISNEKDINKLITTGNVNRTAGNNLLKQSDSWLNKILGLDKQMVDTAKQTAKNIGKQIDKEIELYNQGKLNKEQQEQLKNNIKEQVDYNNKVIEKLKQQGKDTKELEELNKKLDTQLYSVGSQIKWNENMTSQWAQENENVRTGYDGTVEVLKSIDDMELSDKNVKINVDAETNTAFNKLSDLAVNIANSVKKAFGNIDLSQLVKPYLGKIEAMAKLGDKLMPGTNQLATFNRIKASLGLAKGGIINLPGKGVPLANGVIGGEVSREGVIPLTDSQQMALLGEAIGKYININATVPVYVGNRQIAKEIRKIDAENDFAYNR